MHHPRPGRPWWSRASPLLIVVFMFGCSGTSEPTQEDEKAAQVLAELIQMQDESQDSVRIKEVRQELLADRGMTEQDIRAWIDIMRSDQERSAAIAKQVTELLKDRDQPANPAYRSGP